MSETTTKPDTLNRHFVSIHADHVIAMRPPLKLTKAHAIELAAWLVVMAEMLDGDAPTFDETKRAIENT